MGTSLLDVGLGMLICLGVVALFLRVPNGSVVGRASLCVVLVGACWLVVYSVVQLVGWL